MCMPSNKNLQDILVSFLTKQVSPQGFFAERGFFTANDLDKLIQDSEKLNRALDIVHAFINSLIIRTTTSNKKITENDIKNDLNTVLSSLCGNDKEELETLVAFIFGRVAETSRYREFILAISSSAESLPQDNSPEVFNIRGELDFTNFPLLGDQDSRTNWAKQDVQKSQRALDKLNKLNISDDDDISKHLTRDELAVFRLRQLPSEMCFGRAKQEHEIIKNEYNEHKLRLEKETEKAKEICKNRKISFCRLHEMKYLFDPQNRTDIALTGSQIIGHLGELRTKIIQVVEGPTDNSSSKFGLFKSPCQQTTTLKEESFSSNTSEGQSQNKNEPRM